MEGRLVIPARPHHLIMPGVQNGQMGNVKLLVDRPELAQWVIDTSLCAYSLFYEGRILAVAGIQKDYIDPGKGTAWALFAKDAGRHLLFVLKKSVEVMDNVDMRRIETTASHELPQAKRWLELLGFEYEGTMRSYDSMGYDHDMYARVRHGH